MTNNHMKKLFLILILSLPTVLFGQIIRLKSSVSDGSMPEMVWTTTAKIDTVEFNVFRSVAGKNNFSEIFTIHFAHEFETSDTTEFTVIDTTLEEKGLYEYSISAKINGASVHSEITMAHNYGILPKPHLKSFNAEPLADRKAILLKWELAYAKTVSSLQLFRSSKYDSSYIKVTDLPVDTGKFIDVVPVANEPWFYFIVINDFFGGKIQSVRIPAFATFSEKPFRPHNIHGKFSNDSILIDWENTGGNIIGYRVYRSINQNPFLLLSDMKDNVLKNAVFIDTSEVVKKSVQLRYYICNVSDGFVESTPSDTLSFYITEHEPVLAPETPDYIVDTNGNVKLLWMANPASADIGYNVYLTPSDGNTLKLNEKMVSQNSFTDTVLRAPGKYFYEIESVGLNNKVSANKSGVTVYFYPLKIHVIIDVSRQSNGFAISWKRPLNRHIKKLELEKQTEDGKTTLLKTVNNTSDVIVTDKGLKSGNTYLYKLSATLDNGDKIVVNKGVSIIW